MSENDVHSRLLDLLRAAGAAYELTEHQAVFTSEQAAAARGAPLQSGAKALVLRGGDRFVLAVVPANLSLDSAALRRALGTRRIRFATAQELLELTGLTPGAIPPFGSLFGIETVCDPGLAANEHINFNAASHEKSVQMRYGDWLALEAPQVVSIARAGPGAAQ